MLLACQSISHTFFELKRQAVGIKEPKSYYIKPEQKPLSRKYPNGYFPLLLRPPSIECPNTHMNKIEYKDGTVVCINN